MNILLLDDEPELLDLLEVILVMHDYNVTKCTSSKDAIERLQTSRYDLLLLDVMMPNISGWEVCTEIRKFSSIPIIMLTARDDPRDMVKGLNLEADDYITKPFDPDVLVARIQAVLRRQPKKNILSVEELTINIDTVMVAYKGIELTFTPTEFRILHLFMSHPNRVFSRDDLIELIWNGETFIENRTVDSHIRNVRDKLKKVGFSINTYLKTVYGFGYRWEVK